MQTKNQGEIDETMSQEPAFTESKKDDTFVFDEDQKSTDSSQEEKDETETNSDTSTEDNKKDVAQDDKGTKADGEDEQKVPYSRFKKKVDEIASMQVTISSLEERLKEIETAKKSESTDPKDIEVPPEWVELYGDSDVSKKAYAIQLKREQQIEEKAIQRAIERITTAQKEEAKRVADNEKTIEDNLSSLSDSIGKKLTAKEEEDILAIVDEFSPVDASGKYTSLFPFDKAYEIYTLRNGKKQDTTKKERIKVADLTSKKSEGDADTSTSPYERGWDNWRKAL